MVSTSLVHIKQQFLCGGTIISNNSIVTSSSCIFDDVVNINLNGKPLTLKIEPNKYHKSLESMFRVYIGLHNISSISEYTDTDISVAVKKIIKVCISFGYRFPENYT